MSGTGKIVARNGGLWGFMGGGLCVSGNGDGGVVVPGFIVDSTKNEWAFNY